MLLLLSAFALGVQATLAVLLVILFVDSYRKDEW